MSNRSGMDMNDEEIEFADHAALSVMEALVGEKTLSGAEGERKTLAAQAYKMAKEMVVARRKFIQEHGAPPDFADDEAEEDDLDS